MTAKVSLGFGRLPDTELDNFAQGVIDALTGNAAFPAPPITLVNLQAATDDLTAKMAAAQTGGPADTAAKNNSRQTMISMLRDVAASSPLRYVALRYFNVAGSDSGGRIGQATPKATLLIKVACEAAVGKRPHVSIYGTDYPTPDGTGVRDYIHVEDLATAHLDALSYLRKGGTPQVLNVGYGHGYSVREVLKSVERIAGHSLTIREEPRRAGDPPVIVARADRVRSELGWQPRLDDLDTIVKTSLQWEHRLAREPW